MPKLRSHWKKAVTVLLSVGIACSTASVAQAAVSMTYTPAVWDPSKADTITAAATCK